jgi:hypothetical protein
MMISDKQFFDFCKAYSLEHELGAEHDEIKELGERTRLIGIEVEAICNSIKEYVNNDPYLSDLKKSSEKKVETRSKAKILADKFTELLK